jgi:hypothetical protein
VYLADSWRFVLAYLSARYGPQLALTFFTAAAGWIVTGFLGYQLYLVCAGGWAVMVWWCGAELIGGCGVLGCWVVVVGSCRLVGPGPH